MTDTVAVGETFSDDFQGTQPLFWANWLTYGRGQISRPKLLFACVACDLAIVFLAGMGLYPHALGSALDAFVVAAICASASIATVALMSMNWTYTVRSLPNVMPQSLKAVYALSLVFCVGVGAISLAGFVPPESKWILPWLVISAALVALSRLALNALMRQWAEQGRLVRRAVLVGGGDEASSIIEQLERSPTRSTEILGIFDDRDESRSPDAVNGKAKLGCFEQLAGFCRSSCVDLLIVTVPLRAEDRLLAILKQVLQMPVEVRIAGVGSKLRFAPDSYRMVDGVPMLPVMDRPLNDWDRAIKNLEDRILGTLLLIAALPVMAVCALLVRLSSKGPVLFKQKRHGFNNELIEIYKFRSMYTDKTDAAADKLVTKDDPRVTPIGALLRKTSLDELPQLLNVVRGEMSIVGPRPHATQAKAGDSLYRDVVTSYCARHRMKPGITGWAQINGWRGETDTHDKIKRRVDHDLDYINRWSLWFDLYIILRTPLALLNAKNAY